MAGQYLGASKLRNFQAMTKENAHCFKNSCMKIIELPVIIATIPK